MERLLSLLPTATICVDESERDQYAKAIAGTGAKLALHPPLKNIAHIRNWILDNIEGDVCMIDDDLSGVNCLVGRKVRRITESDAIDRIIRNAWNVARDLELAVFCWQRNPNPMYLNTGDPLGLVIPSAGAFGIIGRTVRFDARLERGEDIDLTMQSLLNERITLCDRRFYFDFGAVFTGKGGNQGIRTGATNEACTALLRKKWGQYLSVDKAKERGSLNMAIRVKRRSDIASTR